MKKLVMFLVITIMLLSGCGVTTERMKDAQDNAPAPQSGGAGDFRERDQIIEADHIGNRLDVLFYAYHLTDDGRLIDQWLCLGRPASSTESIEPNNASPYTSMSTGWKINVDGYPAYTQEVMGIDGTYGEPVPFLFCITPEGHYEQWTPFDKVRITTRPRTYDAPMVRVDESQFVKMEIAKNILSSGGCVDSNLNEIDCTVVEKNLKMKLGGK